MTRTKAITKNIIENYYTQRVLFRFLIGGLIILFAIYIYLIFSITFNISTRKSLENTSRILISEISQLELNYLNKTSEIDKNYALLNGFVEIKQGIFVSRPITYVAIR